MTDFGAFVELAPGVDALLHVSQISREHVAKTSRRTVKSDRRSKLKLLTSTAKTRRSA